MPNVNHLIIQRMNMKRLVPLALVLLVAACSRPEQSASGDPAGAAAENGGLIVEVPSGVAPTLSGTCNIEAVDGVVVQDMNPIAVKARRFPVAGWLIDEVGGDAPSELVVRIASQSGDGRVWQHKVVPAIERPDVQQAHGGAAGALKSGFSSEIDASALDAGTYRLTLSYRRGGQSVVCDNGRAVILK
jgi:hypothetical protein